MFHLPMAVQARVSEAMVSSLALHNTKRLIAKETEADRRQLRQEIE